jgi:hypothetical protein
LEFLLPLNNTNFEYFEYLLNPSSDWFEELQIVRTFMHRGGRVSRGKIVKKTAWAHIGNMNKCGAGLCK